MGHLITNPDEEKSSTLVLMYKEGQDAKKIHTFMAQITCLIE